MIDRSASGLRKVFDAVAPFTVGLEEEVMVLDPQTLALTPSAARLLPAFGGDRRFKPELPAAQIELMTDPTVTVAAAVAALAQSRRDLCAAADGRLRFAAAGTHPLGPVLNELSPDARYSHTRAEYGAVARLQMVSAFQVHVAVGGAERTRLVHNALRSYLPDLAALAANAPYFNGVDSGMASVRPIIGRALPRQGIPPPIESWTEFAADLDWGQASGSMTSAGQWWWELRPHPLHGTLELRVPDAQATIADVTAITAVVHSLVAWLAARADAGDLPDDPPTWRIEENRWSAARHGAAGTMADFATGEQTPTATRLERLLAELAPVAGELGCADELRAADELVAGNGSDRQRAAVAAAGEVRAAVAWLADVFLPPDP